ncbi:MAG: hypothetical protein ABIQ93_10140 [Saprospiraceae bacterium]
MEKQAHQEDPTPPDCFRLEELEEMQTFEKQVLAQVNYYFWINPSTADDPPYRFLFFLELVFEDERSLLLTSGEDTEAIRVSSAEALVKTAEALRVLQEKIVIQRVAAETFPLWADVQRKTLAAIQLSKTEQGLYANDALLLDFGEQQILVQLSRQEGLEVRNYVV